MIAYTALQGRQGWEVAQETLKTCLQESVMRRAATIQHMIYSMERARRGGALGPALGGQRAFAPKEHFNVETGPSAQTNNRGRNSHYM